MKTICHPDQTESSPRFSKKGYFFALVACVLAVLLLDYLYDITDLSGHSTALAAEHLSQPPERIEFPCGSGEFTQYGIDAAGFTQAQESIILQTLDSFAQVLGGSEQLKKLLTVYNGISCQEIFFDPEGVGAYTDIRLTPTVFNIEAALADNYSQYYVATEVEHARVVIGHEIGHLMSYAVLRESGVDWMGQYRERVKRDWQNTSSPKAYEEEAVTQLSLAVLGKGYYYRIQGDKIETAPQRMAEIQAWLADFVSFLRKL